MTDLKRQYQLSAYNAKFTRRIPGLMGRKDDAVPTYTYDAPGGQGYKYVRIADGSGSALTIAFNTAGVADTGDLKLWLEKGSDGRMVIVSERY